jgi:hypothetical protein
VPERGIYFQFEFHVESKTYQEAFELIRKIRPVIAPNISFKRQVQYFVEMGCSLEGSTPLHISYKVQRLVNGATKGKFWEIS